MVESGGPDSRAVAQAVHSHTGSSHIIGITGAPGAGKSTLTSALCGVLAGSGSRVGVLAIDPSSPFSGGAILGDRVRMSDHGLDNDVFIRSMATRGQLGGLSLAAPQGAAVLDAAGFDPVVIETVGVGQVEVDIAGRADTTVVVVNPGWGDAVQAAKAGLMEIADVFVVNKADRDGAGETVRDLETLLTMSPDTGFRAPVLSTVGTDGTGVDQLLEVLAEHREWLESSGELEKRRLHRAEEELRGVLNAAVSQRVAGLCTGEAWEKAVRRIAEGNTDPWTVADDMLAD
jgi:LAO/AO transport system kinase